MLRGVDNIREGIILAVSLFIIGQNFAGALSIIIFSESGTTAVADLTFPYSTSVINISIPIECHILNATMNVSTLDPDIGLPGFPNAVQVSLNNTTLWEFTGADCGAFGMQDKFVNNKSLWKTGFNNSGGSDIAEMRLPLNAYIYNATMNVNCTGPGAIYYYKNFTGIGNGDQFGVSVSNAGDVNNDGYDDVIVGANLCDSGGGDAGSAYIYLGGNTMDEIADVNLTGLVANDQFGASVSGAGDVNNDGFDDVIVGAPFHDGPFFNSGNAYIFFGGKNMDNVADVILDDGSAEDQFGLSVSGVGDVNKDGYDDVLIGGPYNDNKASDAGRAYLYLGGANMDAIADQVFIGEAAGDRFGGPVSGAGDVNKDGYYDVIVGAQFNDAVATSAGKAYLYLGGAIMDATADIIFAGSVSYDYLGISVSSAGDINADGYDDVIIGTACSNGSNMFNGSALIFYGGSHMDNIPDVIFNGSGIYDWFGASVSSAGDINKDGYGDVIVGAYGNRSGGGDSGRAYIYFGGLNMDNIVDTVFTGESARSYFGYSVSGAGDLNKDGYDDVIIGASLNNTAKIIAKQPGILAFNLSVGNDTYMNFGGYTNGTQRLNISHALKNYMDNPAPSGHDAYGNYYVDIPIKLSAQSTGNVSLSKLNITYNCVAAVPDFANALNQYILAHRLYNDTNGNLIVPIMLRSESPGIVKLQDLMINADMAPTQIVPISDFEMEEDTKTADLMDIAEYFKDDYDGVKQLKFGIGSTTNGSIVKVEIINGSHISVNAGDGIQNDNWTGVVEIIVKVSDRWGSTTFSNPFKVVVTEVPDSPVIFSEPLTVATAGQEYNYKVVAYDADGDTLRYFLSKKPQNMTINETIGNITWIPQSGGSYNISIVVKDGRFTVFQNYTISVANRPPRILNMTVPVAYVDEYYTYDIPVKDDDGDPLRFVLQSNVTNITLDASTGKIQWTPVQVGIYPVSVKVDDGTDSIMYFFNITVVQGNRIPVFRSSPILIGFVGVPYSFIANASDIDGDILTYSLIESPSGMTIDPSIGKIDWRPVKSGDFTIKIKAKDGKGGECIEEFIVHVTDKVNAKVEFISPSENIKAMGKLNVSCRVIKGSLNVEKVQVRLDSGDWLDATGNTTWQYIFDTTKINKGKHVLQARAYDGIDYSDAVNRTILVDNSQSGGRGIIPGFGGLMIVAAIIMLLSRYCRKKDG